jgi:hypothetical protein
VEAGPVLGRRRPLTRRRPCGGGNDLPMENGGGNADARLMGSPHGPESCA